MAQRAVALGMKSLAYDPYAEHVPAGTRLCRLGELIAQADVISLHTALTPETRHILNSDNIKLVKRGAYIINTARGELVDELALYQALVEGYLAVAALDVFSHEPPHESPLVGLANVIATPHVASITHEAVKRMSVATSKNLLDGLLNQDNPNRIV